MFSITSNLSEVATSLTAKLKSLSDADGEVRDQMLRTMALDTVAQMKERIHVQGLDSNGKALGEYSNAYMKVREQNNRGTSRKVIYSLTRQMENDFSVVGGNGATGYDLGFKNPDNAVKAEKLEARFGDTYKPTEAEVAHMVVVAEQFINDLFK
jgi:hypothetical protein